jgi:GNAT superfamily N-acetyltransferase
MTDLVDLGIRQFVGGWRVLCAAAPACVIESGDGVEHIFSCVPIAFFNASILAARGVSADNLRAHGERACRWAVGRNVAWLFIATQEALDPGVDCAAVLESCGLAPLMSLTGMVAPDVAPARAPDHLDLQTADSDAACVAALDVNAAAYAMSLDAGKSVWGRRSYWKDHFLSLGLSGGRPVSAAAVLMVDGHRYVALVATTPDQRRRGFADAAMRHALDAARQSHGDRPTFLHATEAGRPVYERMGYEAVTTHHVFMERKFLGQH